MSKRGDFERLRDIEEAIARIARYTGDLDYDGLLRDTKTQDAIIRNLEILGEAVKHISAEFKKKHRDIDWKKIAGTRDKLVHDYFGVNWDIVWNVITEKLGPLRAQVQTLLNKKDEKT